MRAAGFQLGGSGWRSNAEQRYLYAKHCHRGRCSPPTAVPGTSEHEWGLAMDLTCGGAAVAKFSPCWQALSRLGPPRGWRNLPSEGWHWSFDAT
jgi:D-alanyl-D-alanine carboxypeptidase